MLDKYFNKIEKELNRVFDTESSWSPLRMPYQINDFPPPQKNDDQPNFNYTYTTYTIDPDLKANLIQQADIYISEMGDYRINVLVAGYDKKDIKVFTDEKDSTILTVVFESVKKKNNIKYIQQQIPKGPRHLQFRIDTQKYNIENTTGDVRDGILYLSIPKLKNSKKVNLTF